MIEEIKEKSRKIFGLLDMNTIFMGVVFAIAVSYYINPLENIDLESWDRTFCSAILSGYSIEKRIGNFYRLFFLYMPVLSIVFSYIFGILFIYREKSKEFFATFNPLLILVTFVSYISRFTSEKTDIVDNNLMLCIIVFYIAIFVISIIDIKQTIAFSDIVQIYILFICNAMLFSIFGKSKDYLSYAIWAGIISVAHSVVINHEKINERVSSSIRLFAYFVMWIPAIVRISLEGLYFLNEKGRHTQDYYTHVLQAIIVVAAIFAIGSFCGRKNVSKFKIIGYIGAIFSVTIISNFQFAYQYTWSYGSFANIYEKGNQAVGMDTILFGKLPVIDYFSAHAIGDVLPSLIYCFIHKDINGILVNPYDWIMTGLAYSILFIIVKNLFDDDKSILYVLLFPGIIGGIKWISVCGISVMMLIYIYKNQRIRDYLCFWLAVLFGAFYTYDEGISLGLACIGAFVVIMLINKEKKQLVRFFISGVVIGGVALAFYIGYAVITGIHIVSRMKEWLSVSVGSSSSWATASFGDQTTLAFLIAYFVVPMTAVLLLVIILIKYIKNREHGLIVLLTVAYAFTELLYITRTIVYHNLAVCMGRTGVCLNFIHWTVSLFVLYKLSENDKADNERYFGWIASMFAVMLLECCMVTQLFPSSGSVLSSNALRVADSWELTDGNTDNIDKKRIVLDDSSQLLVNQFRTVFDTVLTDDQTFVDFANVTSVYMLTDRIRPCYVGQSPSLLTNMYSQECFLREIKEYDCPIAVLGTTGTSYLQQMVGIPHNLRYYKIAEYIYENYRPLVAFGEIAIWCEKDCFDDYKAKLSTIDMDSMGYEFIDYGYDFTTQYEDENGNILYDFKPFHSYDMGKVPYIWANMDDYDAISNEILLEIEPKQGNSYMFEGSMKVVNAKGNYLTFSCNNTSEDDIQMHIVLYDSNEEGAKFEYYFKAIPGDNEYAIRISEDYFWDKFNIDTIIFEEKESVTVSELKVLEGD